MYWLALQLSLFVLPCQLCRPSLAMLKNEAFNGFSYSTIIVVGHNSLRSLLNLQVYLQTSFVLTTLIGKLEVAKTVFTACVVDRMEWSTRNIGITLGLHCKVLQST